MTKNIWELLDQLHGKNNNAELIYAGLQFNMKTDLCQVANLMAHKLDLCQINQTQM